MNCRLSRGVGEISSTVFEGIVAHLDHLLEVSGREQE